jgi:hypothetical protein
MKPRWRVKHCGTGSDQAVHGQTSKDPNPWKKLAMTVARQIYGPLTYVERLRGFNSDLAQYARWIVRAAEEKPKPNGDRLREYRDSALPSLEQRLLSTAPIYKNFETVMMADSLAQMQEALALTTPLSGRGDRSPDEAARRIGTKLDTSPPKRHGGGGEASAPDADRAWEWTGARASAKRYDDNRRRESVTARSSPRPGSSRAASSAARCGFARPELWRGEATKKTVRRFPFHHQGGLRVPACRRARNKPPYNLAS